MTSDHRDGSTIIKLPSIVSSIETWGEYKGFSFSKYSAVVCHKLSHFNSRASTGVLEIVADYWKLRSFQDAQINFNWVTKETIYQVCIVDFLEWNLISQVAGLFRRRRTMLKILYFSRDHQFFQKSLGIKFLYDFL